MQTCKGVKCNFMHTIEHLLPSLKNIRMLEICFMIPGMKVIRLLVMSTELVNFFSGSYKKPMTGPITLLYKEI